MRAIIVIATIAFSIVLFGFLAFIGNFVLDLLVANVEVYYPAAWNIISMCFSIMIGGYIYAKGIAEVFIEGGFRI